jgi:hypothetical protein
VSGIHAVRVAARLRRELGIDVKKVHGRYGQFQVLVDNEVVVDGGSLAMISVLPSGREVVAAVKSRL